MPIIHSIKAIQVIDSRGTPTVSCKVILENGISAISMVPSGASTGSREALELRDGDAAYMGKGVNKAIANIHEIITPALIGMDVTNQQEIDEKMLDLDGTSSKSKLGANAILGVSLAVLEADVSVEAEVEVEGEGMHWYMSGIDVGPARSEERRVGKECRSRWSPYH